MKSIQYLSLIIFIFAFAVTSCKKNDATKSKKELLTSKQWKFTSSKTNGVEDMLDCSKDDYVIFASNGTYTSNPGTIKCDPSDAVVTGTWKLSTNEKTIIIDNSQELTIIELSQSKLIISYSDYSDIIEQTLIAF